MSFEHVFAESARVEKESFDNFRDQYKRFHFLLPVGDQRWGPDYEAIGIAAMTDLRLCSMYLSKPKSTLGYAHKEEYVPIDMIDSRHIMMSTLIFSKIGRKVGRILEIGGGWGNWFRLNEGIIDFKHWDIVDLPFVTELQRWYLAQTAYNRELYSVYRTDDISNGEKYDLIIAAHSLSELSLEAFTDYFENVLSKTRYVFYATHVSLPSTELVRAKIEMLGSKFDRLSETYHCDRQAVNILYERKRT